MFGEKLDTSYNTCNNHEDICYTDEGFLLVASSSLTYRYWKGKICLYTEQASSQGCTINNQLKQPPPHTVFSENTITNMKYLSSSNIVLTSHDSGEVALWKLPEENDEFNGIASNVGHDDSILSLDINADQSKFVSGSSDCQIKIWSVSECNIQAAYTGHSELVSSTAFHPSSLDVLASCSQDRKMLFWDLRKLKPVFNSYTFNDLVPNLVTYFKSDPNLLLIASEAGEVVQMDTRKLSHCLSKTQLHKSTINRISLSQSNPNFLATCSDDLSVVVSKLHKDSSLNIEYKDTSHKDFVKGIVWSPKRSSLIASCSWDGNIFLHNTILSSNIPSKNFGDA